MNRRIEISIDELVLHGFSEIDRGRLDAALRGELGRLLQNPELPDTLRNLSSVAQLNLPALNMQDATSPEQIGVQVARSLVRSWQPAPPPAPSTPRRPAAGPTLEKGKRP